MLQSYTPPARVARSLLIHSGDFRVNQVGTVTPTEYLPLTTTVTPPQSINAGILAPFTHFDATVMQAANYDEIVVDIQPVVTAASSVPQVSTSTCGEIYNQISMSGRPYWILIDPSGYRNPSLYATRITALSTALAVMASIYIDLVNYQMTTKFMGFAFTSPDLNVMFTDGSVIDRPFQSSLIQASWSYKCGACIITARPNDTLGLISTTILPLTITSGKTVTQIVNPNSNSSPSSSAANVAGAGGSTPGGGSPSGSVSSPSTPTAGASVPFGGANLTNEINAVEAFAGQSFFVTPVITPPQSLNLSRPGKPKYVATEPVKGKKFAARRLRSAAPSSTTTSISTVTVGSGATAETITSITTVLDTVNTTSNTALPNPILGCNASQKDKLIILYPNVQAQGHDISVTIGQLAATLVPTNRDLGFTPNIDLSYAVPINNAMMSADGTGGVSSSGVGLSSISSILGFAAAMGITSLGVYGVPTTGINVPAPMQFVPPDANVNTTGFNSTWAAGGNVYVAYPGPVVNNLPTTTVRQFSSTFVETVPYIGSTLV